MLTATILSALLAGSPGADATARDFAAQLDHAEFVSDEDLQLIAYDARGAVIGTIALWLDERGRVHLVSDYADGYANVLVVDERATIDATLAPEVIRERADLVLSKLLSGSSNPPRRSPLVCAATIASAVGLCAVGGAVVVITCPAGVILALCACAPVLDIEVTGCEE